MALDEVLLTASSTLGRAVFRVYAWKEPAASFGYFQKYADVERATLLRPLVRRPTGGGLVPHDADWTYSLAFPTTHRWYDLTAAQSYQHVHEWIRQAFANLGVQTELATDCLKRQPGLCFIGHEKSDLLWHGKKIAGAAQRRTRAGLLIQGSVQPPCPIPAGEWQRAMKDIALSHQGAEWLDWTVPESLHQEALRLAEQKYCQAAYNRKR
jgi:lipoate-protein ligase A